MVPVLPRPATTTEDFAVARRLFREYQCWLQLDLGYQDFAAELASLERQYGPPQGALLLAYVGDEPAGCVGVRAWGPGIAEMKRMYVPEAFRGRGLGRALMEGSIAAARALGYRSLRLDSMPRLAAAVGLYRQRGFRDIPPYCASPDPGAIYLELQL